MGITSNEAKQRYNAGHYTQVKVSVPHETAAAFKSKCAAAGVSMASELKNFMSGNISQKPLSLRTRQLRRRAVIMLVRQIEAVMIAEQDYINNIPENLRNSRVYDAAEQTVSALEEALDILNEAY